MYALHFIQKFEHHVDGSKFIFSIKWIFLHFDSGAVWLVSFDFPLIANRLKGGQKWIRALVFKRFTSQPVVFFRCGLVSYPFYQVNWCESSWVWWFNALPAGQNRWDDYYKRFDDNLKCLLLDYGLLWDFDTQSRKSPAFLFVTHLSRCFQLKINANIY